LYRVDYFIFDTKAYGQMIMKQTPLYARHVALNARIIDFGGWAMPVQYTNVIDEHKTTRNAAALFDICHMGEFEIKGPQALELLQLALTRNLQNQEIGQIKLSAMLNLQGGIIDDLTVYKIDNDFFMLVTNASTRERDWQWLKSIQEEKGFDCSLEDISDQTGKLDLQGPNAQEIFQTLTFFDLNNVRFYHFFEAKVLGQPVIISRSGYTGEDGFEIYAQSEIIGDIWDKLLAAGENLGLKPAGLGARDTLRLEAGMMLNGQDITEATSPLEVPYGWLIDSDKEFIGKTAFTHLNNSGVKKKLVGLEMSGRGIARHGYKVFHGGKEIGIVTSGTFTPTVNKAIGLAFVEINCSAPDTQIDIAIRDSLSPAKVVKTPFYKRAK
jgi:aminomethyltransferase